jgi:hypothetical protein
MEVFPLKSTKYVIAYMSAEICKRKLHDIFFLTKNTISALTGLRMCKEVNNFYINYCMISVADYDCKFKSLNIFRTVINSAVQAQQCKL